MKHKLPMVVAALALLVVVGIWWQLGSQAVPELSYEGAGRLSQPVAPGAGHAATPQRRMREDLRVKRDAWLAAREQQRGTNAPAAAGFERRPQAGQPPAAAAPPAHDGLREQAPVDVPGAAPPRADDEFEELKQAALSDPDPDERINALWSLSVADEAKALPVLASALRDEDREVRLAAVQEIGGLEDEGAIVDALAFALGDDDAEVRAEAVRLLGDTEDPRIATMATRLLDDPDPDVREEAQAVIEAAEE